jgi:geranylgeranyl pyrophosphate synthase
MPPSHHRSELDACRTELRDVASRCGGRETAELVGEAKLLRATLVLSAGSSLGATADGLVPAAVSIELLHLASLVHDDIIDEAERRRGTLALHIALGRDRALVVGDLLIIGAFNALSGVPPERYARCVAALTDGARRCCVGQLEELAGGAMTTERYLDVAAEKTGSLFAAAASLGALVAGADGRGLARFGMALGLAYQIRDDLSDGQGTVASDVLYASASDAARAALADVPKPCIEPLALLVDTILGSSAAAAPAGRR